MVPRSLYPRALSVIGYHPLEGTVLDGLGGGGIFSKFSNYLNVKFAENY